MEKPTERHKLKRTSEEFIPNSEAVSYNLKLSPFQHELTKTYSSELFYLQNGYSFTNSFHRLPRYSCLEDVKHVFTPLTNLNPSKKYISKNAHYIIVKSNNYDDIHKSIKYGIWSCSTPENNTELNNIWYIAEESEKVIFLLVMKENSSFTIGIAQLASNLHKEASFPLWFDSMKSSNYFDLKWIYIKTLDVCALNKDNSNNFDTANDCTEVETTTGQRIMNQYRTIKSTGSIFDIFPVLDLREDKLITHKTSTQPNLEIDLENLGNQHKPINLNTRRRKTRRDKKKKITKESKDQYVKKRKEENKENPEPKRKRRGNKKKKNLNKEKHKGKMEISESAGKGESERSQSKGKGRITKQHNPFKKQQHNRKRKYHQDDEYVKKNGSELSQGDGDGKGGTQSKRKKQKTKSNHYRRKNGGFGNSEEEYVTKSSINTVSKQIVEKD